MADRLLEMSETDLTFPVDEKNSENTKKQLSNDKTIIELGYRQISWFLCHDVSQITIFCSTAPNNCCLSTNKVKKVNWPPKKKKRPTFRALGFRQDQSESLQEIEVST